MASRSSSIEHPAKQVIVMIREDYLAICSGDDCAAALLNYFEHWTNGRLDAKEQWLRQCEIAKKTGEPLPPAPDVWIYASQEQIQTDLMYVFGERKIGNALDWLAEVGFLLARNNPKHSWDRTKQYQLDVVFVQLAIREIAEWIGVEMRNRTPQKRDIEEGKNAEALPKTIDKPQDKPQEKDIRQLTSAIVIETWLAVQSAVKPKAYSLKSNHELARALIEQGVNCDDLTGYIQWRRQDKYWNKFLSLEHVAENILAWKKTHAPKPAPVEPTPYDGDDVVILPDNFFEGILK